MLLESLYTVKYFGETGANMIIIHLDGKIIAQCLKKEYILGGITELVQTI